MTIFYRLSSPNFKGVTPILDDDWEYNAKFSIQVIEPISAVEVRFIPFNVWGKKDRTLTMTEISDLDVGLHELDAKWRTFENDAVEHFASLAYVCRCKTKFRQNYTSRLGQCCGSCQRIFSRFHGRRLGKR